MNIWVSHIVRKAESTIERYKTQLVANEETYSLEVKFSFIRLILALVTYMNLKLHQMDVIMVLLYRELKEEIYMEHPVNFVSKDQRAHKCACFINVWFEMILWKVVSLFFGQAVMSYRLLMTKDSHGKYTKRLKIIFILSISVDYMFWLEIMKSL